MSRTFVIGDVHGCSAELSTMITLFELSSDDHIIFAGDLIHKGPDSIGVLQTAQKLAEQCKVSYVAGNHEEKQLRWARNEALSRLTGKKNPMKHVEGYSELQDACDTKTIAFIENSRMYVEAEGFLILHGGLPPHGVLEDISLKGLHELKSSEKDKAKWILFTRFVNPSGNPVSMGHETNEDIYWPHTYNGWAGTILFGHQPFMQEKIQRYEHAIGLDLGCVYGNLLAAVEISDNKIIQEFYVKAFQQYANPYFQD